MSVELLKALASIPQGLHYLLEGMDDKSIDYVVKNVEKFRHFVNQNYDYFRPFAEQEEDLKAMVHQRVLQEYANIADDPPL